MDKEKLANSLMWISMAMLFTFSAATSLMKGFKDENNLFLVAGGVMIIGLFFCGFKGISTMLDAIFKK